MDLLGYQFGRFRLDDSDGTQVRGLPDKDLIIDTDEDISDRFGDIVAENWARQNYKFTKSQLLQLKEKAEEYFKRYTSFMNAEYFYRDKPKRFFDEAEQCNGIMKAYEKDNTGDPKSPINRKIDGLFFATSQPPSYFSFFGDTRIKVPAKFFLSRQAQHGNTSNKVRLYFADFYCMDRGSSRHWVTIVLTYKGSAADEFCQHKLPRLNLNDNTFLMFKDGSVKVRSSDRDRIEMYYAGDVDIKYWKDNGAVIEGVSTAGAGSSTPGGKPKRSACSTCNL